MGFAGLASLELPVPAVGTVDAPAAPAVMVAATEEGMRDGERHASAEAETARRAANETAAITISNLPTHVVVRQRLGSTRTHYSGPLHIAGETLGARQLEVRSSAPIAVNWRPTADGAVEPLQLRAPGYRTASCAPTRDRTQGEAVEVVLEPAASLVFEIVGPGGNETSFAVRVEHGEQSASGLLRGTSAGDVTSARGELAIPGGGDRAWSVDWKDGERLVSASGTAMALGLEEQRLVAVDLRRVPMQRHRLVGPSSALLAHCNVAWRRSGRRGGVDQVEVAADGSFFRSTDELEPVLVDLDDGVVATTLRSDRDEVQCHVAEALVGIQLLDGDARPVCCRRLGVMGEFRSGAKEMHLLRRSELPDTVTLWVYGRIRTFAVPRMGGDLIVLHEADAMPQTSVTVVVEGEWPPTESWRALALQLRQVDGDVTRRQQVVERTTFVLPAGGEFDLAWCVETLPGPQVLRVALATGEARVVNVAWPQVCAWTGEVEGHLQTPLPQRCHRVGFGPGASFLSGWTMRLDPSGRFHGIRLASQPPPEPVFLVWGSMKLPAVCEQPDPAVPHLVVRPASALRWQQFAVEATAPWRLVVSEATAEGTRVAHVVTPEQQWPMPIGDSAVRSWVLERFEGERSVVLAFGEVGAEATTRVAPAPARRVVIEGRGRGPAICSWLGPRGQSSTSFEVAACARFEAEVPADTRGLWVRGEAAATEWREVPIGADGVVRLDG